MNIIQKALFFILLHPLTGFSQDPGNWQHLDPEMDTILGISTYRAYQYLQGRKADTVVVAIIDNGVELTHEDLLGVLWINENEIKDNQVDDDSNGYIDDVYGWNFLGNPGGDNMKYETLELTRLYSSYNGRYKDADTAAFDSAQRVEYMRYLGIKKKYESEVSQKTHEIAQLEQVLSDYLLSDSIIRKHLKKEKYEKEDVQKIRSRKLQVVTAKEKLLRLYAYDITPDYLENRISNLKNDLQTRLNPDLRNREEIVRDDPDDLNDTIYGNNMLNVRGPSHGTGVAGVVGALQNDTGIDGIAKAVRLMILRVVPNGDERDKDVALAIKYAVRNGADIINCSFGKRYSAHPEFVQEAVAEAERKGVLIVHGAGNDAENIDNVTYYPNGLRRDGTKAANWITVGASMSYDDMQLAAPFSNYGKSAVDVFAPGYGITTCTLNDGYNSSGGTSIAAPMVAGAAAVLKSYFPNLTAQDIKDILIRSVWIPKARNVRQPGGEEGKIIDLASLSVSGGIVNLFRAVVLADLEYGNTSTTQ